LRKALKKSPVKSRRLFLSVGWFLSQTFLFCDFANGSLPNQAPVRFSRTRFLNYATLVCFCYGCVVNGAKTTGKMDKIIVSIAFGCFMETPKL
jgi:hypothetical protein